MTAVLELPTEQKFLEYANSRGLSGIPIDTEKGIIEGVKILGTKSRNGRVYPMKTIRDAAHLYEGSKVNVDHPVGKSDQPRGYRDRLGVLRSIQVKDDGLYGTLHYNPSHALAEQLAWDAANSPENVGFSHNVTGRTASKGGTVIVESILRVQSVDLVADPATTAGLFEHYQAGDTGGGKNMPLSINDVRADAGIVKELREEWAAEMRGSDEAKATAAKLAELTESLATATAELDKHASTEAQRKRLAEVDAMITEAKLPERLDSGLLREQLAAADADGAKRIIEERVEIAKSLAADASRPKSKNAEDEGALKESTEDTLSRWGR